jgi:RNA polymerase sigma-70 factor (ECF subfamily)
MGLDDAELMARWRQGDAGAFEALVRRWQQPMGRFLYRLTGNAERAADLCQEVFLRLYQHGPRYRESGNFSTWLYRIALNAARDTGRRDRRAPVPLNNHEPTDRTASPESICRRDELADLVARGVAELPESLREALVLHHYENLSFEEMARLTGTPATTLKSRFSAALSRLRQRLRQLGLGPEETEP